MWQIIELLLLLLIFILLRKAKRAMVPNSMEANFKRERATGREKERKRERERGGGREGDDKQFCSVNRAILQCQ